MHRFIPAMTSLAGTKIAEIKVKHHAREFGESKYGLTRIYKVLVDLITIKTILSSFSRPLRIFSIVAGLSTLIGLIALFTGITQDNNEPSAVFYSVGILYICLSVLLMLWGILGELIYTTGDLKMDHFAQIKQKQATRLEGIQ
jgi:hypothetical protein